MDAMKSLLFKVIFCLCVMYQTNITSTLTTLVVNVFFILLYLYQHTIMFKYK